MCNQAQPVFASATYSRRLHPTSYPNPSAPTLVCLLLCVPLPYSSARAATSSRQKSGMSGTARPQTEWECSRDIRIRLRGASRSTDMMGPLPWLVCAVV
jgi:hypothetical protein